MQISVYCIIILIFYLKNRIRSNYGIKVLTCAKLGHQNTLFWYGITRNNKLNLRTRPDFGVEQVVVDCDTPQYNASKCIEDNLENIRQKINRKVNIKKQADGILVNALNIPSRQLQIMENMINQWISPPDPQHISYLKELLLVKQFADGFNYLVSLTPTGESINPSNIHKRTYLHNTSK